MLPTRVTPINRNFLGSNLARLRSGSSIVSWATDLLPPRTLLASTYDFNPGTSLRTARQGNASRSTRVHSQVATTQRFLGDLSARVFLPLKLDRVLRTSERRNAPRLCKGVSRLYIRKSRYLAEHLGIQAAFAATAASGSRSCGCVEAQPAQGEAERPRSTNLEETPSPYECARGRHCYSARFCIQPPR